MSETQSPKPEGEGEVKEVTLKLKLDPNGLKDALQAIADQREHLKEAVNNRMLTALLVNVHSILKAHADELYLMDNGADDVTRLDPTVFKLFRGLDGGFDYQQLREFTNWLAGGIANRRVSGVPGTEES